ncbi:hypothetical protein B9Q03_04195 [Candidatus Marsarchaeota G2 archaeon OSP_D]|uniref:Uncharacterized protein n=2 Tax=Candidatus Marsarchaeota group 2 TaxID=2203771 RepID=A0A2R6BTQ6_9ARCH|nr:MAG: hypothetical protein B9Q03_04195 [Candidatus Marsarchaeota G2 archaeon OSP_D]PSO02012.1 MAG: hypothetical protein B9Q04_20445 [Candidatus Marsarchaeota G2 archaeon BE_D]
MVVQFKMKCKKCGAYSDVTKYVVTPTYVFIAQICGHRHFIDTQKLESELAELGVRNKLIIEELTLNLTRPRNYPTGEGKHE